MKKIKALGIVALVLLAGVVIGIGYSVKADTVYQPSALFDTQLAQSIQNNTSTVTMVLQNGTDGDGNLLNGNYCFTVDGGLSNVEYICGNASGTVVSNLVRGVSFTDGTVTYTSHLQNHRIGADVKITDEPYLSQFARILNGVGTFPNVVKYAAGVSTSTIGANGQNVASVNYVNGVAIAGSPNGSVSVNGIYQLATTSQLKVGTTLGSTGAYLVVPASAVNQSSTPFSLCLTNASGTIDPNCVNLSGINFPFAYGGDGSNGSTTISATTTLTGDSYYTNLTVATSATLFTGNYRVFVSGTLTINGTVNNSGFNGGNGSNASGTTGGVAGSAASTTPIGFYPATVSVTGATGGAGGTGVGNGGGGGGGGGGASNGGVIGIFAKNIIVNASGSIVSIGGNGGNGGAAASGFGGGAGCYGGGSGGNNSTSSNTTNALGSAGSSGGAGGASGSGGCGAAGGGTSTAGTLTSTSTVHDAVTASSFTYRASFLNGSGISAAGAGGGGAPGVGGAGIGGGGGGGGAGAPGGVILMVYQSLTMNGTTTVSGGSAGTFGSGASGGSNGFAGTAGNAGIIYKIQIL